MEGSLCPCLLTRPIRYVLLSLLKVACHMILVVSGVTLCKQFAGLCPVRFWTEVDFITGAIVVVFMKNKEVNKNK